MAEEMSGLVFANLVYETSITSGTGPLSLNPVTGYRTFAEAVGDGKRCKYHIHDGVDYEIGTGTVTVGAPSTLSRDEVEVSSNNDALVNFGTAEKDVYLVFSAEMYREVYLSGRVYGIRYDQANDILEKGILVSGTFVPVDYGPGEIQQTLARVLRDPASGIVHALHPDDSNYLADGTTAAVFDGSMGDVQVRIPAHYQLWHKNGNYRYILMSWQPFSFDGAQAWQPLCFQGKRYYYHDAFEPVWYDASAATLKDHDGVTLADTGTDIMRSLPGYKPVTYQTRAEFRQLYTNRGGGTFQNMWDAHQMLAALFYAEYGTLDGQAVLPGYTQVSVLDYAYVRKTGRTLSLGNSSGSILVDLAGVDSDLSGIVANGEYIANSYRGVENFFGHLWKWVDGINIDNTVGDCHVYTCTTPTNFADDTAIDYVDTGHAPAFGDAGGYISDILGIGRHAPFYPTALSGSSATYFCDFHWNSLGGWRVARVGGHWADGARAGPACLNAYDGSGNRYSGIAARGAAVSGE